MKPSAARWSLLSRQPFGVGTLYYACPRIGNRDALGGPANGWPWHYYDNNGNPTTHDPDLGCCDRARMRDWGKPFEIPRPIMYEAVYCV